MAIDLDDTNEFAPRTPVMKKRAIGERTKVAIVRFEQRPVKKDGVDVINPRTGKPRQELVVHGLAMTGTTAECGSGDDSWTPKPGDPVRVILRGGGFGQWIEARKEHRAGKIRVGDELRMVIEHAQAYDADGNIKGGKITDQADIDNLRRKGTTIGFYGSLSLAEGTDDAMVTAAERAYREATAINLDVPAAAPAPAPAAAAGGDDW
jgi:hypothetical protein